MSARILNGHAIRDQIYSELQAEITTLSAAGVRPGLAAVRVGEDPASKLYVNSKIAACEKLGLASFHITPPASTSTEELLALINQLNHRDDVDGILVQMPLPKPIDSKKILDEVIPEKDVDGFHPVNVGHLVAGRPALVACTPAGVMEILRRSHIPIEGANAVVIGRSDIVGKPMAMLLLNRHATVTICHSKTRNLPDIAAEADILVAAIGRAAFVTKAFVKRGAAVVDVGTTQLTSPEAVGKLYPPDSKRWQTFERRGSLVVGDVHPEVAEVAGWLSPVPGGVGPLTIAMLLKNTVVAAERAKGLALSP